MKLQTNKFVDATLGFKSVADEYKHADFSLGGLLCLEVLMKFCCMM